MSHAELSRFARIVVSGPHRSGTTIGARVIAHDTGHEFVDEETFGWPQSFLCFVSHLQRRGVVLQAPFFAHELHCLHEHVDPETLCVVAMRRDVAAIEASRRRFNLSGVVGYRRVFFHTTDPTARVVYENWEEQKKRIRHWREIEYESLEGNPLWVAQRTHFAHRQTA